MLSPRSNANMLNRLVRSGAQLIGALGLLSGLAVAAPPDHADSTATAFPQRPRVGLVLAGGGAKGGAHVGVLKVLEEMHVPIDCIAGTSMGALAGGGYALASTQSCRSESGAGSGVL